MRGRGRPGGGKPWRGRSPSGVRLLPRKPVSQSRLAASTAWSRSPRSSSGAEAFDDVLRLTAAAARDALDAASLSLSVWERDRGRVRVLLNVGDLGPGEVP